MTQFLLQFVRAHLYLALVLIAPVWGQSNADFGPPPAPRLSRAQPTPTVPQGTPNVLSNGVQLIPDSGFDAPPMARTNAVPRQRVPANIRQVDLELAAPVDMFQEPMAPTSGSMLGLSPAQISGTDELSLPSTEAIEPYPTLATGDEESREPAPTFISAPVEESAPPFTTVTQQATPVQTLVPNYGQGMDSLGWWQPHIGQSMRTNSQPLPITLEQMIAAAVQHSAQIRVFSDAPLIRDTEVIESASDFDWTGYVDTMWTDTDEPVGSTLTTGGPPRFQNHRWQQNMGFRRKNTRGGQFDIGQQIGHENSNSIFFVPNNQGTARLTIGYSQPLLRGGGKIYNTSLIVLAQINASVAQDEFSNQLQTQLLDVSNAYWSLYLDRGSLLQQQRLYKRGEIILTHLEKRQEIDALANQIVRARAAVTSRKSNLYRAAASVKNSEARLRALVNAPYLGNVGEFELLPQDIPATSEFPVDMATSMTLAVQHRPEVHQAMKQIRAASVRLNMAKNELLPLLDVVLETYVNGLNGDSNIGRSLRNQFSDGAPSYSAGLQMELPMRNRAARSRMQRRSIESRQLRSNFEATVYGLGLEVETAVREVHTTFREISANYESMRATASEVDYITKRWKHLTGEDRSASLLLEDLLAAQERLQNEEREFLRALVSYNLSVMSLKQVTGTLLQLEQVNVSQSTDGTGAPQLQLQKAAYSSHPYSTSSVVPAQATGTTYTTP